MKLLHFTLALLISTIALAQSGPTLVTLSSNSGNSNAVANTLGDVPGLSFPVISGNRYYFKFVITYSAAATTTGSRWTINGPAVTDLVYNSSYSLTATTETLNISLTAYNLPAASNLSSAQTTRNIVIIEGIITPSANGNVIARCASEVASSAITALGSTSYVTYQKLN